VRTSAPLLWLLLDEQDQGAPVPQVDLRSYVTDRSLDGLFTVLGQEEERIRTDPSARVTELLRTVFGP